MPTSNMDSLAPDTVELFATRNTVTLSSTYRAGVEPGVIAGQGPKHNGYDFQTPTRRRDPRPFQLVGVCLFEVFMSTPIVISGVEISTDADGRFSLNDLHKASGGDASKRPGYWLSLEGTKELIEELALEITDISAVKTMDGRSGGTFVHDLLLISYASWISPKFQLQVNRVFLAYRRGELVHSSTPPELRARLDSLVEAKAKGLISGFNASQMALEAIRSNWHKLPALPAGDTDTMPIFQVLLRAQVKVSGEAFREPRMMTIYETAVTAKDGEYGAEDCLNGLNRIGIDLHHGSLAINPGNQDLCDLLRLRGPSVLKDALLTEPGMMESKVKVMVGLTPCKPLLIPLGSL